MNIREFEQIKNKIETAKDNSSRIKGAMSKYEEQWKNEFKVNTIEEAQTLLEKTEESILDDETQVDKMYSKLEKVADWDAIE